MAETPYATATAGGALPASIGQAITRLRSWNTKAEPCANCRRASASVLRADRALCRACAGTRATPTRAAVSRGVSGRPPRYLDVTIGRLWARNQQILAEIEREGR